MKLEDGTEIDGDELCFEMSDDGSSLRCLNGEIISRIATPVCTYIVVRTEKADVLVTLGMSGGRADRYMHVVRVLKSFPEGRPK